MDRLTRSELRRRGKMGFSAEDYEEWIRRGAEKREDIQAHKIALAELKEKGLGERLGVTEAGLGRRKEEAREFARPLQAAKIGGARAVAGEARARTGETRARTEKERYGLEFERSLEPTLEEIVKQKKRYGELDIEALELGLRGGRARPGVPEVAAPAITAAPVVPVEEKKRKRRPYPRAVPFGAYESLRGLTDWLRRGTRSEAR